MKLFPNTRQQRRTVNTRERLTNRASHAAAAEGYGRVKIPLSLILPSEAASRLSSFPSDVVK